MNPRVAILGAGPAGLVAAHTLSRLGCETVVFEKSATPGGMLRTVRRDGFLAEEGPHTLRLAGNGTTDILNSAGLASRIIDADTAAKKRFITLNGKPVAAPGSPAGLIGSPLLPLAAKLRLLAEPFAACAPKAGEESVADFVRRRLGDKALERLVDAFVGGIHAGDPEQLAVRHAFPSLHRLEREHGGLLRGLFATRDERRARGKPRVTSFPEGMAELPRALAADLGESLRTGYTVSEIRKIAGNWTVAGTNRDGAAREEKFDAVIITAPAHRWDSVPLPAGTESLKKFASAVPHPPVSIVTLGYARERVEHALDGFGVLTPSVEKRRALGVLFPSSLFEERAPDGAVTLSVFVGGTRNPEFALLPKEKIAALARRECEELLGASGEPEFVHTATWEKAIPQYTAGHGEFLAALDACEQAMPGLYFCGNYRGGVAVTSAMESAASLARKIAGRES